MKGITVASIFGLAAFGMSAVVVDDFSTGMFTYTKTGTGSVSANKSGTMLGGSRWAVSTVTMNPLTIAPLTATVNGGIADVSAGTLVKHVTDLRYGYSLTNALDDMDADLASMGGMFKLAFLSNEKDLTLTVQVRQTNGASATWASYSTVVGSDENAFDYYVPFSVFGAFDMTNVDQLIFRFGNQQSGDFALDSVEIDAVPEPATMVGLGLGLAFLARKRRKA